MNLAPVTRPTPLAGAPLHQLEYYSIAALTSAYKKRTYIYHAEICVTAVYGGEEGIRTLVGLPPNGFQDRLVMTASIPLRLKAGGDEFQHAVCV